MSCLDKGVVKLLDEGVVECLDKNNKDNFDIYIRHRLDDCLNILSSHTPCNTFLRYPWLENVYPTMIILRKVAGMRLMPNYLIIKNRKNQ